MSTRQKFGVYLPKDLLDELEKVMSDAGIESRSKLVQEAIRMFLIEQRWKLAGKVAGVIGLVYDHTVKSVDDMLTDIQHRYLDVVIAALHVHLDPVKCMLIIVVRGDTNRIKSLYGELMRVDGVLLIRPVLLSAEDGSSMRGTGITSA